MPAKRLKHKPTIGFKIHGRMYTIGFAGMINRIILRILPAKPIMYILPSYYFFKMNLLCLSAILNKIIDNLTQKMSLE
jgi:hypothetical protein